MKSAIKLLLLFFAVVLISSDDKFLALSGVFMAVSSLSMIYQSIATKKPGERD